VNDAGRVRAASPSGYVAHDRGGQGKRDRPGPAHELRENLAVGPLEREIMKAAGRLSELVRLHHGGMGHAGAVFGFPQETLDGGPVARSLARRIFIAHTPRAGVLGTVYRRRAPFTHPFE